MQIVKLVNIVSQANGGALDYKGLDIDQFVPGAQVYADDLSFALIKTAEVVIPNHSDITVISQQQYEDEIAAIIAARPKPLEEKVLDQEQRLADVELALAEMFTGGGV